MKRFFLTVDYVCSTCGWSVRVRTAAPQKHAMCYAQGISQDTCFRCRQRMSMANCRCCKSNAEKYAAPATGTTGEGEGKAAQRSKTP